MRDKEIYWRYKGWYLGGGGGSVGVKAVGARDVEANGEVGEK